ncbi:hypothetical protein T11_17512 [Trichinella zimbabwensis]|uniref:Uncharacterized protein n=1 Tax=Trichinella zimbabwensis TaxID=268475 RepID=A0A0V1HVA1_9BILA|nr:hypothetical protein T11_17512 [Trichinella zimbabwensis]
MCRASLKHVAGEPHLQKWWEQRKGCSQRAFRTPCLSSNDLKLLPLLSSCWHQSVRAPLTVRPWRPWTILSAPAIVQQNSTNRHTCKDKKQATS